MKLMQMEIDHKYIILFIIPFITIIHAQDLNYTLPDIEEYQLNNGMRVLISPNYESPIINIFMQINVGNLDDPIDKFELGSTVFWALNDGTKKYPKKDQLKEKLFSLGNTSGAFKNSDFSDDRAYISHICLKEDTKDCIEIFSEIVRHPTFPFYNKLIQKLTVMWLPNRLFAYPFNSTWKHAQYMYNGLVSYFNPLKGSYNR